MKAEQFIKDYTRRCSNELCAVEDRYGKKVISYHEWLTPEQALSAVAIERKEVIEESCDWLKRNGSYYIGFEQGQPCVTEELIKSLKKYLEK